MATLKEKATITRVFFLINYETIVKRFLTRASVDDGFSRKQIRPRAGKAA